MQKIVTEVYNQIKELESKGAAANYIPELARVNPNQFGIHITETNNQQFGIGDCQLPFSIQSIAKVISLSMAYRKLGEKIWSRVGVEPSGTPFNSLVQLEKDHGIPRNPFINAGALVVCDCLISELDNAIDELLAFTQSLSECKTISYSPTIAKSEQASGYRNKALCNFLKALGNINNDPEEVLDFYFHLCSIELSCEDLSRVFSFLANEGKTLHDNAAILTPSQAKRINALMQTCGFYDESGEFSFKVGLPGKSGVGGGIIAIHPTQYAIAVWSPALNEKGNSYKGMKFLEEFTTRTQKSIF